VQNKFLLGILLLFSVGPAYSQDTGVTLIDILNELESRFTVSFSYEDDVVSSIKSDAPDYNLELDEILSFLANETGLEFIRINERYIAIRQVSENTSQLVNYCGTVKDSVSGDMLAYAVVYTADQQVTTNENGEFTIRAKKGTTFFIQTLGYRTYNGTITAMEQCSEIRLTQSIFTLDEIVIRDFLVMGVNLTAGGNFEISTQQMQGLPGLLEPDVLQTAQTLPGIQSVQESVSDINIRGGTNDENLVMYEGIRMYLTGHFFGLISSINPYITDEVSLIQQGTPVQFSDAVSGTLDIRVDDDVADKITGSAGVNMINADVSVHIPIANDKVSLLVAGRRSLADLIETPTYRSYFNRAFQNSDLEETSTGFRSNEAFQFSEFYSKLLVNPDNKTRIRANVFYNSNEVSYEEEAEIGGNTESRNSGLVQESLGGNVFIRREINSGISLSGQAYYSEYSLAAVNNDLINDQRLVQENEVQDNGLQLDVHYRPGKHVQINTGYQFSEKGISNLEEINNPPFRRFIKRVLRIHSVYSEGIFQSADRRTQLRSGLRLQYLDKFDRTILEPRLSFRQNIFDNLYGELSAERKSQSVTQVIDFQTDFLGIEKRRWLLANEGDIPVAVSYQVTGGLQFTKANFISRASVYLKKVEGITTASQGFQNQIQFDRTVGEYEVKGLDLFAKWTYGDWQVYSAYTLAENIFSSDSLGTFPNTLDIRHTLSSGLIFNTNRINVATGITWHTGRPYSQAIGSGPGNTIRYEETNASRLSDYFRWDASVSYKFALGEKLRGEAGVSVWNITNQQNISNILYRKDEENQIEEIRQQALRFTPNMMLRVFF